MIASVTAQQGGTEKPKAVYPHVVSVRSDLHSQCDAAWNIR